MRHIRHLAAVLAATALTAGGVAAVTTARAEASAPGYVAHSALINGDSVTTEDGLTDSGGNPISLEEYAAQHAGFTTTVVSGSQWQAMTAAQFAKYQVLVVGDPDCGYTPASVVDSAPTWAPVVMGTAGGSADVGNRALVATDPEFHYPDHPGALHLVQDGIAYAGGVAGATGVYFDTSCADPGGDVAVLNSLSAGTGSFAENTEPPCGGQVQLIADVAEFASLEDSDIQGWDCSDHITFPTYPTDWQPLAVATDAPTSPTCGTDPSTATTACGEAYVFIAGRGIVVTAPDLSLSPTSDTAPAGGSQTVTASVSQGGTPVASQLVSFDVTGTNAGVSGTCAPSTCQTDASGQVTFTYADADGAGSDTINASTTIGATTEHATSSMTWTAATGPTVNAGPDVSGHVGDPIGLDGSSTGTTSTTWSFPAGTPCSISDAGALDVTVTCTAAGDYTITLTGTDGTTTVSDTADVHVTDPSTGGGGGPTCFGQTPTIVGTAGDDTITGTPGNDVIVAGKGNDTIISTGGDDVVCGNQGDDVIKSRTGNDMFVNGGSGDDTVIGGRGDDTVIGGQGDDLVRGNSGDDRVYGRIGDDHLIGGAGDDHLYGNGGDDVLVGGQGTNVLDGGGDTDRCGLASDGPSTTMSCEGPV